MPYLSRYILVLLAGMILSWQSTAAGPQDRKVLDLSIPSVRSNYAAQLAERSLSAKAEAEAWARARGIPIRYDDGRQLFELMYIDDGRPVYNMTHNVYAAISIATDLVRNTAPYNLNGSGFTGGIWDGGAVLSTHQEFGGRVNVMDGASSHYHSTHVGGTIGAVGIDANALGMAPSVDIDSYEWTSDTSEMASRGASYPGEPGKIYVSNHSYGHIAGWVYTNWSGSWAYHWNPYSTWSGASSYEQNFGQYDTTARTYDEVAYNAPYYLIFKSAGNDRSDNPSMGSTVYYSTNGGIIWFPISYSTSTCAPGDGIVKNGYDTITHVGVSKNVMTVGSVSDAVSGSLRSVGNANMSYFSCWGPADDGRIKPDIVTNGESLYSTDDASNSSYYTLSGTSMASPGACGSAILLAEYYTELFPSQAMRSSTLKALIIHTADDRGNPGPDYSYGWGLMNTKAAADVIADQNNFPSEPIITEAVLDTGNPSDTYEISWDGNSPLKATLCWTDPPGSATSAHDDTTAKLINDLDLLLTAPGGYPQYYPYILNPASPSSTATTGDNTLDNVEQIELSSTGIAGIYTLQVSHKSTLTNGSQVYSLIITKQGYQLIQQPPVAEDVNISIPVNTPVTIELIGDDDGLPDPPAALDYIISSLPAYGSLSDPNATAITGVPYTLIGQGNQVIYTPDPNFYGIDSFLYKVNDGGTEPNGGDSNLATVTIEVSGSIYSANMDTDPGWSAEGQWQWGQPTGQGGTSYGYPDPTGGYTGSNVHGINLSGDYSTSVGGPYYLTTQAIDCNGFINIHLSFYRWLNSHYQKYVYATIEVSNNGTEWTEIWENGTAPAITDSSWQVVDYDISEVADNQTSVYIRWSHRVARGNALPYSGWNIDDVELNGDLIPPQQYTLTVSSTSGGSVTSPGEGSFQYNDGTAVDLNASPEVGYNFNNWTGDTSTIADTNSATTTITVDANYSITANFEFFGTPPAITSTSVTTAVVDQLYTYDVNATGIPAPTYSLLISPNDMIIDSNTGLIEWTPTEQNIGPNVPVTVRAENTVGFDQQSFEIDVNGITPEITSIPITSATVNLLYTYDVNADGIPAPVYSLIISPNDMIIDSNTGLVEWTPAEQNIEPNVPVTVRAENTEGFDQQSFEIDVNGIAPVITSIPITTATADFLYSYNLDANGIPAPTFSLTISPNDMTIDPNTGLIEWTPDYFDIAQYTPVTVEAINLQDSQQQNFEIEVLTGDNFDDNTRSAMWCTFKDNYQQVTIVEDQNRMELLSPDANNTAAAFYTTNNWTLDINESFAVQVDFHYTPDANKPGWIGLAAEGEQKYIAISAGADSNELYYYFEVIIDGNLISEQQVRDSNSGTLYIWYNTDSNNLYLSNVSFDTNDAYVWQTVGNPLTQSWTGPVDITLGGGSQGGIFNSGDAYLDNFKVVKGRLHNWPPVTDLDLDGFIGLGDLAAFAADWLTEPNATPDFDADGDVDFSDFAELGLAW